MTVDTITGEVYEAGLTPFEARALTDEIRQTLTVGHDLLIRAYEGRAWTALGYESWDVYCAGEFSEARMVRLDREQRREIVAEMREAGMSTRAIATGLGVSKNTVTEDIAQVSHIGTPVEPRPITGTDGKTYQPTPRPVTPIRPTPKRDDAEVVLNRVLRSMQEAVREAQSLTPAQLSRISSEAAHYNDRILAAVDASSHYAKRKLLPPSIIGLCWYVFSGLDADQCVEFFDRLDDGANLSFNHPISVLRNKLIDLTREPGRVPEDLLLHYVVKTWNLYRAKKPATVLRVGANEKFPTPR